MDTVKCGDANPNGNIALKFKGGCGQPVNIADAYRCVGCGGRFHLDCIKKHFELEKAHDVGREKVKKDIEVFIINNSRPSNEIMKIVRGIRKI